MADPAATNESYEIKRVHMAAAACTAAFMHQLGGIMMPRTSLAWNPQVYNRFLNGDRWRKDNQVIDFHYDHHDGRKSEYVMFSDPVYGPDSDFVEGTPKLLTPVELNVDGLTKIFDNSKGRDPLHIAYEESVELSNSVSTSVRNAFTFDVTTTSETTVSGSYAGAELEEKLTEEVHIGEEKETARDEEEDKTVSSSVAIEFDCPAGAIKQVTVTKRHQKELIPVKGVFVLDFSIKLKLRHWWNHDAGGVKYRKHSQDYLEVSSVKGLYEMMRGVDTDYPQFEGFWNDGNACQREVREGILHLLQPENRSYYLDADKERVIENNTDYAVVDLETANHGDGEVIDLSDEQNREAYGKGG